MLASRQLGWKGLADLCQRVGTALEAGLDVRTIWQREAQRSTASRQPMIDPVRQAVDAGRGMAEALDCAGEAFPPLVKRLVHAGERTGRLGQVWLRLAEHYRHLAHLRRTFFVRALWPIIELALAIVVIGVLILVLGWVERSTGQRADMLGFGLVGVTGLMKYLMILALLAAGVVLLVSAYRRGILAGPLLRLARRIPSLGVAWNATSLARFAGTLAMAEEAGLNPRESLDLAFDSTDNPLFIAEKDRVVRAVAAGSEIHQALRASNVFPDDVLDVVEVGEQTGQLAESLAHLAGQYQKRAEASATAMMIVASVGVWVLVAGVLILLIVRVFSFYLGLLNQVV